MIEYWAVIGLACLDDEFREKLVKAKGNARTLNQLMKDNCFRLSLYELGEVQRLMRIPKVVESMEAIYDAEWSEETICWTAKTFNPRYLHPQETFVKNQGRTVREITLSPVVPPGKNVPSSVRFAGKHGPVFVNRPAKKAARKKK